MDKLNTTEFSNILSDVRTSYRLLALYQDRIIETVKYIGNQYNMDFDSGWMKFCKSNPNGNRARIEAWGWDWLSLYLYEFNMGWREIDGQNYWFKVVHQADTGYYDVNKGEQISKRDVEHYSPSEKSTTRLFLMLSKEGGCPMHNLLNSHLDSESGGIIRKGNWMAVPYDLSEFINQEKTDKVIYDFRNICKKEYGIDITSTMSIDVEFKEV